MPWEFSVSAQQMVSVIMGFLGAGIVLAMIVAVVAARFFPQLIRALFSMFSRR